MRILKVKNDGYPSYVDISTPEKEVAAFKNLFKQLEELGAFYTNNEEAIENDKRAEKETEEWLLVKRLAEEGKLSKNQYYDECVMKLYNHERYKKEELEQIDLYQKAKNGDIKSLYKLFKKRPHKEEWEILNVEDPLKGTNGH
jgi:hypothetical protein